MIKTSFASLALTALLLLAPRANADTLNLSLLQSLQYALPGSTVSFNATVFSLPANTGTLFLNADNSTLDFPLTLNDDGFFLGFPLSLEPGESFTGLLFTVSLPSDTALNTVFNGSFQILGGASGDDLGVLANVNFQVSTASPVLAAVPEPSTYGLLGAALLGVIIVVRRRLSAAAMAIGDAA